MWVVIAEKRDISENKYFEVLACFNTEENARLYSIKKGREWESLYVDVVYADILD